RDRRRDTEKEVSARNRTGRGQCRNGSGNRQPAGDLTKDHPFEGAKAEITTDNLTVVRIVLSSSRRRGLREARHASRPILDFLGGPVPPPGPPPFREGPAVPLRVPSLRDRQLGLLASSSRRDAVSPPRAVANSPKDDLGGFVETRGRWAKASPPAFVRLPLRP